MVFVHYFARSNDAGQPVLRDGTVITPGMRHHAEGEIILCTNSYHGSVKALDALEYAAGHWYCPRELSGQIVAGNDKVAASDAITLATIDVGNLLHEFACREAEIALTAVGATDERSWSAIAAKRAWLRGEISDDDLYIARAAARAAAWDAAWAAAWATAWDAAWDAAWATARDAARAAARATARDAAWAAAWATARDAAWAAARATARDAAWDAARAASNQRLEVMLAELVRG